MQTAGLKIIILKAHRRSFTTPCGLEIPTIWVKL
jgi:hypothetical protein